MSTAVVARAQVPLRTSGGLSATGVFEVAGHDVAWRIEPDGWLSATTPLDGSPAVLLARQTVIPGLAKIAAGPGLRAELPVTRDAAPAIAALRSELHLGLAILCGRPSPEPEDGEPLAVLGGDNHEPESVERLARPRGGNLGPEEEERTTGAAQTTLAGYAPSYGWEWTANGAGWRCVAETSRLTQRVDVSLAASRVRFAATLVRWSRLRQPSPAALTHFLLALNRHLRLARGGLDGTSVRLEVVLPARGLDAGLVDHALGAVVVGAGVARRECAALGDPAVAEAYCTFHHIELDEADKEATS